MKDNEMIANGLTVDILSPQEVHDALNPPYGSNAWAEATLHFRWDNWHFIGINDGEQHTSKYCTYCERRKLALVKKA